MIIRGNENPFLRGKVPKEHIRTSFSTMPNPFEGMSENERALAISEFAQAHADNFSKSLVRLREICRSYNFFQLLAHFGYYDQIVLDGEKRDRKYNPVEQNGVEFLQALILQVSAMNYVFGWKSSASRNSG